jgi:hypothetical protein
MRRLALVLALALPALGERPLLVHVTVALCDNATQGIVPVPPAIGDGNDPRTNLYWGASYGVKTWLKKEKWAIERASAPDSAILERLVARKTIGGREVILTADAWRGSRIRDAITAFLEQASGLREKADVVAYIGHDGLMEFTVAPRAGPKGTKPRSIVLACASKQYFSEHLARAGSEPLLLTTGLMAPEAYTLTATIEAHVQHGDVREAAARAYHRHQSCGLNAARRLFANR